MYEDTPVRSVGETFENLLYKNNPLGRDIIGYKKTLKSLKRKDFIDYMNRFYMANDTVVCIAGKFDEKKAIGKISGYFEKMGRGEKPKIVKVDDKQNSPRVKLKYKKTDQSHLVLGVRAYDQDHKDRFALALMSIILGGNMSSRLFIEVREKRGLAYYVRSMIESYKDCGYLAVQAGVEHGNLMLALSTILREFKKIAKEKVSPEELKRAKDFIRGKSIMGMEASDEVAMFFLEQEVTRGKIMTIEEIFARFDKVAASDILRVAKDVFKKNKLNLAVIGPHKDSKKFEKLLAI
jgi:predicted Zn-dependent peptidase